jgi:hypothetical protein
MAGMVYAPRTPESIRTLLAYFAFAIALTYAAWRLDVPLRGMNTKKDGPLSKSAKWVIAIATVGLFLILAFFNAAQRRQLGLPVF